MLGSDRGWSYQSQLFYVYLFLLRYVMFYWNFSTNAKNQLSIFFRTAWQPCFIMKMSLRRGFFFRQSQNNLTQYIKFRRACGFQNLMWTGTAFFSFSCIIIFFIYWYWKAKKDFGSIRNFLKIYWNGGEWRSTRDEWITMLQSGDEALIFVFVFQYHKTEPKLFPEQILFS